MEKDFICPACRRTRPYFDRALSTFHYTDIVQTLIKDFKYHNAVWLAYDLALFMTICVNTHLPDLQVDLIASVPLHPVKRRERSYNQAGLLADRLSNLLRKPVCANMIYRTRQTRTQTHLTAKERKANMNGVFVVINRRACDGRNILLVDDVITTGATLNECAKELKGAGACEVTALTVARG